VAAARSLRDWLAGTTGVTAPEVTFAVTGAVAGEGGPPRASLAMKALPGARPASGSPDSPGSQ
jgi:hypothetical protein